MKYRNLTMDYRGFYVTLEVRSETIYAFWCNDKEEQSKRFSGYSLNDIKDIICQNIDANLIGTNP